MRRGYSSGTSPLGLVPDEFLFRMQPIFDMVAVLPATCLVQTEGQLSNLIACRGRSTGDVLSQSPPTSGVRGGDISSLFYDSLSPWPPLRRLWAENAHSESVLRAESATFRNESRRVVRYCPEPMFSR